MYDHPPAPTPTRWLKVSHHPAHVIARYPYAGYGSNLQIVQMAHRCPNADIIGSGAIPSSRLIFARVCSIVEDDKTDTLVGIYKLTPSDVTNMDRFEGLGRTYERYLVTPIVNGMPVRCFTYIKKDQSLDAPTSAYYERVLRGYQDWNFSDRRLRRARKRALEAPKPKYNDTGWWAGFAKSGTYATHEPVAANTPRIIKPVSWKCDGCRRVAEASVDTLVDWTCEDCGTVNRRALKTTVAMGTTSLVTGRTIGKNTPMIARKATARPVASVANVGKHTTVSAQHVEWGKAPNNVIHWRIKWNGYLSSWRRDTTTAVELARGVVTGIIISEDDPQPSQEDAP